MRGVSPTIGVTLTRTSGIATSNSGTSGLSAQRRTTHALVVEELRGMILDGALQPGERLRIDDLA